MGDAGKARTDEREAAAEAASKTRKGFLGFLPNRACVRASPSASVRLCLTAAVPSFRVHSLSAQRKKALSGESE